MIMMYKLRADDFCLGRNSCFLPGKFAIILEALPPDDASEGSVDEVVNLIVKIPRWYWLFNYWWFIPLSSLSQSVHLIADGLLGALRLMFDLDQIPIPIRKAYLDNPYRIINFKACGCSWCVACFCFPDFLCQEICSFQPLRVFGELLEEFRWIQGRLPPSPLFVVQRVHS